MKTFTPTTTQIVTAITCDACGAIFDVPGTEASEFVSVDHVCGYDSIHGDGSRIALDLCQHCSGKRLGDLFRKTAPQV
jgi:hypothetical protein